MKNLLVFHDRDLVSNQLHTTHCTQDLSSKKNGTIFVSAHQNKTETCCDHIVPRQRNRILSVRVCVCVTLSYFPISPLRIDFRYTTPIRSTFLRTNETLCFRWVCPPTACSCRFVRFVASNRLPILAQIELEGLDVLIESERRHGPQEVVPVYCFSFFLETLVGCFRRDKAYEFRHTLLYRFF